LGKKLCLRDCAFWKRLGQSLVSVFTSVISTGAASESILKAIETVLAAPDRRLTPDLGGHATTRELGMAIAGALCDGF
jgi:isocitrate/isopropylmalate dehydrogenase